MIIIKTPEEIEILREGGKHLASVLFKLKERVASGISTKELDSYALKLIRDFGDEPAFLNYRPMGARTPFPSSLCVSVNDEVVHGIPAKTVLNDGDIISIDVGVNKNGYFGDAALTVAVGNISPDVQKLMDVTEKSLYLGIEEAIENRRLHNISNAIQSFVEENGFSIVRELTGHGVGKRLHEDPSIPNYGKRDSGPKLKSGMTLAIEPMVNLGKKEVVVGYDGWTVLTKDGLPSAHFEHTILVTNGKPEILTVC